MPRRVVKYLEEAHMAVSDWVGLLAVIMIMILGISAIQQYLRDTAPVEDYFEVKQLYIPDYVEHDNPKITYDRQVKQKYTASWTAEIQDSVTFQNVCNSQKTNLYDPEKGLPDGGPTLSWLMWREPLPDCDVPPGSYRVNICWTIQRERAVPARYCTISNVFRVYDENEWSRHQGPRPR